MIIKGIFHRVWQKLNAVIFLSLLRNNGVLFVAGGIAYGILEVIWRGRTHWTMLVTGGACFVSLYNFYNRFKKLKLIPCCFFGSLIITGAEFICGCIVNIKYKLNVWDYSNCKYNLKGQVCMLYSFLWALLCIPVSTFCKRLGKCATHD